MEHLLALYVKIGEVNPLPIFEKETIIVQNAGMQHWLSMELAKSRKISFNFGYALPAQFLWKLARTIAGEENVPDETLFSREVLSWRILALLMSDEVVADTDFDQVTHFWQGEKSANSQQQKCYQLACQLADLFEQYLIYRPEWITAWNQGELVIDDATNDSIENLSRWQGKLWRLLTKEVQYDPFAILRLAMDKLDEQAEHLPKRISFFGINAMAPIWLDFINEVSRHTQVHFFHLNPCADYWGDIQSDKQVFSQLDSWVKQDELSQLLSNPLLANLGAQGKEFLALLQNYSTINIDAFDEPEIQADALKDTTLAQIQRDILLLNDARTAPVESIDESITITKAHSAMREIQGLHDWLLHQFNQDPDLTPKDVLVMCPEVEQYAPYVSAVFSRTWQDLSDDVPPLPCSIADRVAKNAEPVVAAFLELLQLPDSRFQISQILGLLRVEQVKNKFKLDEQIIELYSQWLETACVHWGINADHKAQVLGLAQTNDKYTWQQALQRLLRGFAYQDEDIIFEEQLLLSQVEGDAGYLLGQLMLILSALEYHAQALSSVKNAEQWQHYLHNFIDDFFETEEPQQLVVIKDAVNLLAQYTGDAQFNQPLSLNVVASFLNSHFSLPDPGRQFMIGQVTFCSMVPMRSIPFKIIAVLGLNDGEFPRQRQPLSYDLMAQTAAKLGDRSRRGDDRYLFLEAIISARQSLYLSYQGNSLKNNAVRQPSIVLKELMDYLEHGYQWQLLDDDKDTRKLPMQPFALSNYQGKYPSFDANWLNLGRTKVEPKSQGTTKIDLVERTLELDVQQLIQFLEHPSKFFARQQLNLYLDSQAVLPQDVEPFQPSHLDAYQFRQALLDNYFNEPEENLAQLTREISQAQLLSGRLPDLPTVEPEMSRWQEDMATFFSTLQENQIDKAQLLPVIYRTSIDYQGQQFEINLSSAVLAVDNTAFVYRPSEPKAKDSMSVLLAQLMGQLGDFVQTPEQAVVEQTTGWFFNTKSQKIEQLQCPFVDDGKLLLDGLLRLFIEGQQQAILTNLPLAEKIAKAKAFGQQEFEAYWQDDNLFNPFSKDPYMQYFWPQIPHFEDLPQSLESVVIEALKRVVKPRKTRGKG